MNLPSDFLKEQESRLRAEHSRIEGELRAIARKEPAAADDYHALSPDYGRDPESNAMEEEVFETRMGLERSLEQHLQDVTSALDRLQGGTYGTCAKCGKPISEDRLRAFPAALTCVEHA